MPWTLKVRLKKWRFLLPAFPQRCVVECKWRWKLGSQSAPWKEKDSKLLSVFKYQTSTVFSVSGVIFPCLSTDSSYSEPPDVQQQLNHYQSAASGEKQQPCEPAALLGPRGALSRKRKLPPLRLLEFSWLYPEHQAPLQGQARWEEALQVQRLLLFTQALSKWCKKNSLEKQGGCSCSTLTTRSFTPLLELKGGLPKGWWTGGVQSSQKEANSRDCF